MSDRVFQLNNIFILGILIILKFINPNKSILIRTALLLTLIDMSHITDSYLMLFIAQLYIDNIIFILTIIMILIDIYSNQLYLIVILGLLNDL